MILWLQEIQMGTSLPVFTESLGTLTYTYDSHHPQSVKRGVAKCLYDHTKHLITRPSVFSEEKSTYHQYLFRTKRHKNQETDN